MTADGFDRSDQLLAASRRWPFHSNSSARPTSGGPLERRSSFLLKADGALCTGTRSMPTRSGIFYAGALLELSLSDDLRGTVRRLRLGTDFGIGASVPRIWWCCAMSGGCLLAGGLDPGRRNRVTPGLSSLASRWRSGLPKACPSHVPPVVGYGIYTPRNGASGNAPCGCVTPLSRGCRYR